MVFLVIKKKFLFGIIIVNVRIYIVMFFYFIKIMFIFRIGFRLIDFDFLWLFESCVLLVVFNFFCVVILYLCCYVMFFWLCDDFSSGCVGN